MMLLWLLACGTGESSLLHQERWELLMLNSDADLLDLRFSRSNTGLLRGGGRVRLEMASRKDIPLGFGRSGLPQEVSALPGGLSVGPDSLSQEGSRWTVLLQEGDIDARFTLEPAFSGLPSPRLDRADGLWTSEALLPLAKVRGFLRAGSRNELMDGEGVLLHQRGEDPPALRGTQRSALFAFSEGLSLGVDQLGGDALTWLWADGSTLPIPDATLLPQEKGFWLIDFGPGVPLSASFRPTRRPKIEDPLDADFSSPERSLLSAWRGVPQREVQGGVLTLKSAEGELRARAILLTVTYQ